MIADVCPFLFRFMEEEYVDRYLESGEIRIASVKQMRCVEDESRRDLFEGFVKSSFINRKMNVRIPLKSIPEENSYVLCTSLSPYSLNTQSSCLKIIDRTGFSLAIKQGLECLGYGVTSMRSGPCVYVGRCFEELVPDSDADTQENERHLKKILKISEGMASFIKDPSYLVENEYRFVWEVDGRTCRREPYILVKVNNPRSYCEKMVLRKSQKYSKHQYRLMRAIRKDVDPSCSFITPCVLHLVAGMRKTFK